MIPKKYIFDLFDSYFLSLQWTIVTRGPSMA